MRRSLRLHSTLKAIDQLYVRKWHLDCEIHGMALVVVPLILQNLPCQGDLDFVQLVHWMVIIQFLNQTTNAKEQSWGTEASKTIFNHADNAVVWCALEIFCPRPRLVGRELRQCGRFSKL
jgi:hypothetical protein